MAAAAEEKKENKADLMEYRMLGGTGLKVSCLGLGMMSFDSEGQAMELMSAVRNYGVNFFDNAELYGEPCGNAETLFGSALKKLQAKDAKLWRRSELVITTKLFFGTSGGDEPNTPMRPYGQNEKGLSRKHLMEGMDESLARLQLDYVDIVMAHRHDALTPMLEIVQGFTDIIRAGKAFYWGTSMWSAQKITEAYWVAKVNKLIAPVVEQPQYNMFFRGVMEKDYLPMFAEPYKIGTTTWSPLDSGILTGKYVKEVPKDSRLGGQNRLGKWWGNEKYVAKEKNAKVEKLMEVAAEMGVSMVSLALGWVIKNKNVSVCLLGGSKASQLEQNCEALAAAKKLDKEKLARIEEILDNDPNPKNAYAFMMRSQQYKTNPI